MTENTGEWFRDWFNTRYYHLLYTNRDEAEAANFLSKLISAPGFPPSGRILDLACGKGRHSKWLADHGYQVTGVDLSEASITEAAKDSRPGLEFFIHDMRFPFRMNYYDAILSLFSSFGYFSNERENRGVIRWAAAGLKPEGVFVLDFMNSEKVIRELVPHESRVEQGVEFNISRYVKNGRIIKDIEVKEGEAVTLFREQVRAYNQTELQTICREFGLEPFLIAGNYELEAYDELSSERLILLARKNP